MKFVKILSEEFSTVLIPLADIKKFEVESLNESFENLEKEGGLLFAKRVKIHTPYQCYTLDPAKLRLEKVKKSLTTKTVTKATTTFLTF